MDISCHSFVRMAKLAAPLMTDGGTMFAMSYYGANRVVPNYNVMGPVKAALEASCRYLAYELGPRGIRVHAISPGPLKTRAASGLKDFELLLNEAAQQGAAGRARRHHGCRLYLRLSRDAVRPPHHRRHRLCRRRRQHRRLTSAVTMTGCIAVLNAGSSSIKFALYEAAATARCCSAARSRASAPAPQLDGRATPRATVVAERTLADGGSTIAAPPREIVTLGRELAGRAAGARPSAIASCMAARDYAAPVRVDADVHGEARDAHAAGAAAPAAQSRADPRRSPTHAPHLPQVACFDTAFHRSQPPVAQAFALPRELTDERRAPLRLPRPVLRLHRQRACARSRRSWPRARLIIAHLGNGASLCAVHDGRSVASTMGFTAVDGLMMGTRCGALDPGVLLYLMDEHGLDAAASRT